MLERKYRTLKPTQACEGYINNCHEARFTTRSALPEAHKPRKAERAALYISIPEEVKAALRRVTDGLDAWQKAAEEDLKLDNFDRRIEIATEEYTKSKSELNSK